MSVTFDANVLIYASNQADPKHAPARNLLERLAAGPDLVSVFWPTIMGYVRIVTHPAILPRPLTVGEATANVSALLRLPHVRAAGELPGFWSFFLAVTGPTTRGNAVPDAHLAALMRQHGVVTIYTWDRDFRSFAGISARRPGD